MFGLIENHSGSDVFGFLRHVDDEAPCGGVTKYDVVSVLLVQGTGTPNELHSTARLNGSFLVNVCRSVLGLLGNP